jgi:hypothetical protein
MICFASGETAVFQRVFRSQAGPTALGILIPPGSPTVVIVRPRSLPWDLLQIEPGTWDAGIRFSAFPREKAEAEAEALARGLEEWSEDGAGRIEAIAAPGSPGHCVRGEFARRVLIACPRLTGQSYRPMVFADEPTAADAARLLREVMCPRPGAVQEIYFNSRHFARA